MHIAHRSFKSLIRAVQAVVLLKGTDSGIFVIEAQGSLEIPKSLRAFVCGVAGEFFAQDIFSELVYEIESVEISGLFSVLRVNKEISELMPVAIAVAADETFGEFKRPSQPERLSKILETVINTSRASEVWIEAQTAAQL